MIINVILKAGLSWMSAILYCVELALVTVYIEITKLFSLDLTSSSDPPHTPNNWYWFKRLSCLGCVLRTTNSNKGASRSVCLTCKLHHAWEKESQFGAMSQNLTLAALGRDGISDKLLRKAPCWTGNPNSPNRAILGASYLKKELSAL